MASASTCSSGKQCSGKGARGSGRGQAAGLLQHPTTPTRALSQRPPQIRNQNSLVDDYDIGTCRISLQTARQTGSETIKAKVSTGAPPRCPSASGQDGHLKSHRSCVEVTAQAHPPPPPPERSVLPLPPPPATSTPNPCETPPRHTQVLDPKGKKRGKLHLRLVWKPAGGALPPAAASNAMHSNAGVPAKPVVAPVGFSQPLQPLQPMQMQGIHMQPMQMQGMAGMQPMQMVASMMSQVMQQMPAAAGGAAVGYGSFGTVAPPPGGAYPAAPPPAQQQYAAEGFLSQPAPAPYGQPPPAAYGPPAPAPYGQPPPAAYGQAAPAPYGQPGPGYPQPQAAYGQPPPAPAQYAAQGFLSQPAPATYGAPAAAPYAGQLMPPAAAGYPGASDPYAKQPPAAPGYGGW